MMYDNPPMAYPQSTGCQNKISFFSERVSALVILATPCHVNKPITIIKVKIFGVKKVLIITISRKLGMDIKISTNRII